MDMMIPRVMLVALAALMASVVVADATPKTPVPKGPIPIWPGVAPGDAGDIGEEKDTTKAGQDPPGKYIIRLGNVSRTTIEVFKPPKSKDTGAAVVVCPGGGYYILAMDLEGTEVCKWLNSIGVTGVLLKYRVPIRKDRPRYAAPLQDAQRAVGLVRHNAREWGIDPSRIGILGFSAGGHLSAAASTNFDSRTYPPVDDADRDSCRPDFTVLIYPAYLTAPETSTTVAPELKVSNSTPPAFIVMAEDDPVHVESAMGYALALKSAKVPVELHIYPKGGHGYGLRPSENAVTTWPARAAEWMAASGFLKPAK